MVIMTINGSPYLVQKDQDGSLGWLRFIYLGGDGTHQVTVYRGQIDEVSLDVYVDGAWSYEGLLDLEEARPYRRASHLV